MTTQSLPISRTRKDYVLSTLIVLGIALISVLGVYFTHPRKLRTNARSKIFGITFPDFQGVVMRQPRMTIVIALAFVFFVTAFVFIARPALSFFSRQLSYACVVVAGLASAGIAFFTDKGTHSGWFRFFILCVVFTAGMTVLTELMVFYRRFFKDASWRTSFLHRLVFAIVIAVIVGAGASLYYHNAVKDGIFLDYGVATPAPVVQSPIPDIPTDTVTPVPSGSVLTPEISTPPTT